MAKVTGTIKELTAKGVQLNGNTLSAAQLSILTTLGVARKVGTVVKETASKGKPASIIELDDATVTFTVPEAVSLTEAKAEEAAPVAEAA